MGTIEQFGCYTYKGVQYIVENEVLVKEPVTRKWVPHVLYRERGELKFFAREKQEFIKLFKAK